MRDPSNKSDGQTLYDMLAEPAPLGAEDGGTVFSFVKESVDRDQEGLEAMILLDAR